MIFTLWSRAFFVAFLVLSPQIATSTGTAASDNQAEDKAMRERRIAPLRSAGIDINSTQGLIDALKDQRVSVRIAAVYLLKEKKVQAAIPALDQTLNDPSTTSLLTLEVCGALAELETDNLSWKQPCEGLLGAGHDSMIRIRAAGLFAKYGDSQGWSLVRNGLTSSDQSDVEEASMIAHFFNGLEFKTNGAKTKINVTAICAEAFRNANEASQISLLGVISDSAKSQDREVISSLIGFAKSQYAKGAISAIVGKLGKQ